MSLFSFGVIKMFKSKSQFAMESVLSKMTLIFQATGLQCFTINAESLESGSFVSRKHKLFLFLNFICVVLEVVISVYVNLCDKKIQNSGKGNLAIQIIAYSSMVSILVIPTVNNFFLRSKAKAFFKNFFKISKILSHLNQDADYSSLKITFNKTLVKLFFGFVFSNAAVNIFTIQSDGNIISSGISAVYPYFFTTALVCYWTLLVRLIGLNLHFIKESIEHLHKKQKLFDLYPESLHKHDSKIRRSQETYNFIAKLKRMYGLVYDSVSLLNELIAIPICVFLVFVILSNISSAYKTFLAVIGDISLARAAGKNIGLEWRNQRVLFEKSQKSQQRYNCREKASHESKKQEKPLE